MQGLRGDGQRECPPVPALRGVLLDYGQGPFCAAGHGAFRCIHPGGGLMNDLPQKPLLRVDEVSQYFDVARSTVYLWIDHGILDAEKIRGVIRITRESIVKCRLASKINPDK